MTAGISLDKHENETPANWVQVAVLGGDAHTIDLADGKTLSQVLNEAEIQLEAGQVVTVNGTAVTDTEQTLEPGSAVMVVSRVKNG